MKRVILYGILLLCGGLGYSPAGAQTTVTANDSLYVVYLLSVVTPQPDVARYVVAYAHLLEGTPYRAGTLDRDTVERLCVNLQEVDCTTFVETVLALARTAAAGSRSFDAFVRQLTAIRYRDGVCEGYLSRLHYFSDWIADAERKGILSDESEAAGGITDTLRLDFMSRNAERYLPLCREPLLIDSLEAQERRLSGTVVRYIPVGQVDSAFLAAVQEGDIIAFTTDVPGLDIAHVGIAVRQEGEVRLIHASSTQHYVVVESRSLVEQLQENPRFSGVRLLRPCGLPAPSGDKK
ncbi:MAG: DUF1460 domain-containing protein [Porphyromonadaceae bacterium]|nr:DUF1460 domain-containing protein [Porphyromonadaceae bacterium]